MAWTDQCKISAVQTIEKVAEDKGLSVRKAIKEVSQEADIPAATLQRWYYPRSKSEVKTDPTNTAKKKNTSPEVRHSIVNGVVYDGPRYENMAIEQLKCIKKEDPRKDDAFQMVIDWCEKELLQTPPKNETKQKNITSLSLAARFGEIAITQLSRIEDDDLAAIETLRTIIAWCEKRLSQIPPMGRASE